VTDGHQGGRSRHHRRVMPHEPKARTLICLARRRCNLLRHRTHYQPPTPEAAVVRCAGLPLALRIVAERAAARPLRPLAELVDELVIERARLTKLATSADDHSAVRTALTWTYRELPADRAAPFRALGPQPGRSFDNGCDEVPAGYKSHFDVFVVSELSTTQSRQRAISPSGVAERKPRDPSRDR
jgi:hypothetical protein